MAACGEDRFHRGRVGIMVEKQTSNGRLEECWVGGLNYPEKNAIREDGEATRDPAGADNNDAIQERLDPGEYLQYKYCAITATYQSLTRDATNMRFGIKVRPADIAAVSKTTRSSSGGSRRSAT